MGHHPPIGAQTVNVSSSGISWILIIIAIAIIAVVAYFIYKIRKV